MSDSVTTGKKRSVWKLFWTVLAIHIAVVLGPLGWDSLRSLWTPPKPIAFRVKIGGTEPSHAPEVGPPERKRPTENPGNAPKVPEPPKTEPPKPEAPKIPPKKAEPKPAKTEPKSKTKPKQEKKNSSKKPVKKTDPAKTKQAKKSSRKTTQKKKQEEVFHDNRWDKFNPASGGTNTNIAVPLGNRDRGQALGKVDNRTPAGGATQAEKEYDEKFRKYLYDRWNPPAGVFITAETAVSLYLKYDASGRILEKRIEKRSPNPELNANAERLLAALDRVPVPPHADEVIITLSPENQ